MQFRPNLGCCTVSSNCIETGHQQPRAYNIPHNNYNDHIVVTMKAAAVSLVLPHGGFSPEQLACRANGFCVCVKRLPGVV